MSYTNSTPNYNLPQWIGTDKPTFLGDFNGAFSAIDTAMKDNADASSAATSTANAANATAVSANTNANTALNTANNAKDTADAATAAAASATSTANTAKTTADNAARAALSNNIDNLAPAYDQTLTYAVGDLVTYVDSNNTGKLYKCIIAVNTPGAFNVNYWDDVTTSEIYQPKIRKVKIGDYTTSDTFGKMADDIYDYIAPYINDLSADAYIEKVTPTAKQIYQYEYSRSGSVRFTYATASTSALSCHTLECKDNNSVWVANNISSTGFAVENYSSENLSSATTIYLWF